MWIRYSPDVVGMWWSHLLDSTPHACLFSNTHRLASILFFLELVWYDLNLKLHPHVFHTTPSENIPWLAESARGLIDTNQIKQIASPIRRKV